MIDMAKVQINLKLEQLSVEYFILLTFCVCP